MSPRNSRIHNLIYGRQGTDSDEHWFSATESAQAAVIIDSAGTAPQDSASANLARDLRHASNSVMAVIGVVEPTSRPHPEILRSEPPSLETRELDDLRLEAYQNMSNGAYSGVLGYLKSVMRPLGRNWSQGLTFRLLAFPSRSRLSIVQQIRQDMLVLGPIQFLFAGAPATMALHLLFYGPLRSRLNYGFVRMILAQVSSSHARTLLLSFQPYFDHLFMGVRLFALFPLLAHRFGQPLGILPMTPILPNFLGRDYWMSSDPVAKLSRELLLVMFVQHAALFLAELTKVIVIELDAEYIGFGRRISQMLSLFSCKKTVKSSEDDHGHSSSISNANRVGQTHLSLMRITNGAVGRIGLVVVEHTLFVLPLQAYVLGRILGRPMEGVGGSGILGLNGWEEVSRWVLQTEWLTALGGMLREVERSFIDV